MLGRRSRAHSRKCAKLLDFDTCARNMYVVPGVADLLTTSKLPMPFRAALTPLPTSAVTGRGE
jgi:hypothetical protein